jgi:hypothetical protein
MKKPPFRAFLAMCLVLIGAAAGAQQTATVKRPAGSPTETPAQFYFRYRTAVQNASSLDEVTRFWQKSLVTEFMQAPPDQRADLAAFKRMYGMLSDVSLVSVSSASDGSSATVSLAGKTADGTTISGTASLVREGGGWRLAAPEVWQDRPPK